MEVKSARHACYTAAKNGINEEKKFPEIPEKLLQPQFKFEEKQIIIDGKCINYMRVGKGSHHVMCVPGAFGTTWTDFMLQLEGFDLDKFTLVGYDTPGFAKSTPPKRNYSKDFHHSDADIVYKLMKALNVPKYSLMGWCYGGIVSIIHTAKFPEAVNKLIVSGARSHILPQEFDIYEKLRSMPLLARTLDHSRVKQYGEEQNGKHWREQIDAMINVYKPKNGIICSDLLQYVKCPTLIFYGANDALVDRSHVKYLESHISNSRTHIYPEGRHNLHSFYAEDFNRRVQDFLLEPI